MPPYNQPHAIRYTPPYNWPHTTLQPASPPTPLQGERGVVCFVVTAVRCLSSAHATLQLASHHPTTGLTPNPSPRGEGSSMLLQRILLGAYPTFGLTSIPRKRRGSNKPCFIAMHIVFARHTTPLSPWRGVGGEAGCRVACCVLCCSFSSFSSFSFFRPLSLSSEYAEQVEEEVDEVEIKC